MLATKRVKAKEPLMTDEIYYNEDLDEGDLNSLNLGSSNCERLKMADDKLN